MRCFPPSRSRSLLLPPPFISPVPSCLSQNVPCGGRLQAAALDGVLDPVCKGWLSRSNRSHAPTPFLPLPPPPLPLIFLQQLREGAADQALDPAYQAWPSDSHVRHARHAHYSRLLLPAPAPPLPFCKQLREGAADQVLDPAYQAWLSSIDTVSCAGLPMDYYATPSKHAWSVAAALGAAALLVAFLSQL